MVRYINCNKSLCNSCKIDSHDSDGHDEKFLSKISVSKNDYEGINSPFEKQKEYLEKIKDINNNYIKSLENDIQIKEKIINTYQKNKYNYNSILNLKNLKIQNNKKYENILKNIIQKNNDNKNNEDNTVKNFVNNFLSILYYSFMINKDESINENIIKCLINELTEINSKNNDIMIIPEKNEKNIENNFSNELFNNKTDFINLNLLSKEKSLNGRINIIENDKKNMNNNKIHLNSNINNMNSYQKLDNLFKSIVSGFNNNNINKNISDYDSQTFSESNNINKAAKNKNGKELKSEEKNIINSGEAKKKNNPNVSGINHMIILKSGNIALSRKEFIEIYNLQKLNFSNNVNHYYNDDIRNNCQIQQIKLTNNKNINYLFELYDQTLLCATYGKIIRVRLKDNDTDYEIYGYLGLLSSELPTKIISLENQFLVILSERDKHILLKLFKNNNNIENNEFNNNNLLKNSSDCDAVPAIGNNYTKLNKKK